MENLWKKASMTDEKDNSGNINVCPPTGTLKVTTFNAGIQQRQRNPNKANFGIEKKFGQDWSESLGRFVDYERIIDRQNDRYYERIVDPETGEVLREIDEPLSEHIGRGSAKP